MIKSHDQAVLVQTRRVDAGRFGYAKAVRRYCRRVYGDNYLAARNKLPVRWPN